jgi:hypothetical protein
MTLQKLLTERNLTTALIVDDGYDVVPLAEDIANNDEGWTNFVADIGADRDVLAGAFPMFDALGAHQLRGSDEFVAAAYRLKGTLRQDLWDLLFQSYEQARTKDVEFLENLEATLKGIGITPVSSGRNFPEGANQASIIFADLFLGAAQSDPDMERSVNKLKELLKGRESSPPIVILMSSSSLLKDKKTHFRDKAQLLGTMFRVYGKRELLEASTLERALERLANHHADALTVAVFLHSWEKGLKRAADRFLEGARRLDLPDYGQISQVLLNFEGQPLGSYMLDVFDRVLQHEVEGDDATIAAATALSNINTTLYPAPYIAGSADLQDLVCRSIWQHPKRLQVRTTVCGAPVSFGDVLIHRSITHPAPPVSVTKPLEVAEEASAEDEAPAEVLIVLTPACDLVREGGPKRIMLLAGAVSNLTPKTWTYKGAGVKTPIIILSNQRRMWIQWDLKDVRTLRPAEVRSLLADGDYLIEHRLRESHALEIQQRLLSDIGRVGVVAKMPATFPVTVTAFTTGTDGKPFALALPAADRDGGVCFTGRDSESAENARLVMTEEAVDQLVTAIKTLDATDVHNKTKDMLKRLKASAGFLTGLHRGIDAPAADKTSLVPLKVHSEDAEGKPVSEIVGYITRNPPDPLADTKHSALVLVLRDLEHDAAVVESLADTKAKEVVAVDVVVSQSPVAADSKLTVGNFGEASSVMFATGDRMGK